MVEAVDSGRRHDWEGGRVWYRREGAGRPIVFALRDRLGYDERPLVVCTVRRTAVGADLLPLCAAAFPRLAHRVDDVGHVAGGTLDEDGRASSRDLQSAPRHWAERTREEARS
jgi:hypothetical protein